jgi:serine/threonine-protein kinase
VLARLSHAATRGAMTQLQTARMQVSKREALLAEANAELDRAVLNDHPGRLSERELGGYRLGPIIGRGGMSEIYRAVRLADGQPAALKVMHERHSGDARQLRRFVREAEIIRALKSRHVVRLYDVSVDVSGNTPAYMAMELLVGHDLGWHLRRDRRFAAERVLTLVEHVADALVEAARASIVHRDLKPQNLFAVDVAGTTAADAPASPIWKVLDFGAGKLPDADTLTRGNIIGTPGYMAPEQVHGDEIGPATDVFALALIAYRALTGRPAFTGRDVPKLLFDVCYMQPLQPGKLVTLSDDVERVIALGVAKSPRERFAGAAELAAALRAALSNSLDPALRERADALIAREPWGERLRGS